MKLSVLVFALLLLALTKSEIAAPCQDSICHIENNCRCSDAKTPYFGPNDSPPPQLISLTVSESLVTTLYHDYLKPLLFGRTNPDGNPIGATFYINHEYTDYELVQDLYVRGFEIGVHSITKNSSQAYWENATLNDLVAEFDGQKQILSKFANIPINDIKGGRVPQLHLEGDIAIDAYVASGLTYDNSWPRREIFNIRPYTLEYQSTQQCYIFMKCPNQSHKNFWIAPLTNIRGYENVECNSLAACLIEGTAREIANWLIREVDYNIKNGKNILTLRLDSYWFQFTENSFQGFQLFLDEMKRRNNIYFVSVQDVIEWIKNPVPLSDYKSPVYNRSPNCKPISCNLSLNNQERYMRSCVPCPPQYPWKGNPLGQ